jgi:hypothetical protein
LYALRRTAAALPPRRRHHAEGVSPTRHRTNSGRRDRGDIDAAQAARLAAPRYRLAGLEPPTERRRPLHMHLDRVIAGAAGQHDAHPARIYAIRADRTGHRGSMHRARPAGDDSAMTVERAEESGTPRAAPSRAALPQRTRACVSLAGRALGARPGKARGGAAGCRRRRRLVVRFRVEGTLSPLRGEKHAIDACMEPAPFASGIAIEAFIGQGQRCPSPPGSPGRHFLGTSRLRDLAAAPRTMATIPGASRLWLFTEPACRRAL